MKTTQTDYEKGLAMKTIQTDYEKGLAMKTTQTDHRKIDIFIRHHNGKQSYFAYACSTTWSSTCKEAKRRYYEAKYPAIGLADIKCRFAS